MPDLDFGTDGAQHHAGALALPPGLIDALAGLPVDRPGLRLRGIPALAALVAPGSLVSGIAAAHLGRPGWAVRAILFDKTPQANWALGWHQDRTICVAVRHEAEGFGPWSVKQGMIHVEPPFALLAAMVTLRLHLDDVGADNAPLLVALGSHRAGRVPEPEVEAMARRYGTAACLAKAGDIWAYATPILHASRIAERPTRRRVLQIDFSADALPGGLEWLGV